jgi:hypothetical protein
MPSRAALLCFACHLLSCWFLAKLILWPWRRRQYVSPKYQFTFNGLHDVIPQTAELFVTTALRTLNPTQNLLAMYYPLILSFDCALFETCIKKFKTSDIKSWDQKWKVIIVLVGFLYFECDNGFKGYTVNTHTSRFSYMRASYALHNSACQDKFSSLLPPTQIFQIHTIPVFVLWR